MAILSAVLLQAQSINGDMNHNGKLEVNDLTHLISNYLTNTTEQIEDEIDYYTEKNDLITGTWNVTGSYEVGMPESITFNADGTTDYMAGCTYKFGPAQGYIFFFDTNNLPKALLKVPYIGRQPHLYKDYLTILFAGSQTPITYISAKERYPNKNGYENGKEYIELGLSVKWASMNIGASSPEERGSYFAWGETAGKDAYYWENYQWANGDESTIFKYINNKENSQADQKTTLEAEDDAAQVCWGGKWRMPTKDELLELQGKCTWSWTTQNGIGGYNVTGPNGNAIFLPVTGCYVEDDFYEGDGYYWSSSLCNTISGWKMIFDRARNIYMSSGGRYCGMSIRAVCP